MHSRVLGYGLSHILDTSYKEFFRVTLSEAASGKRVDSYIDGHEPIHYTPEFYLVSAVNFT